MYYGLAKKQDYFAERINRFVALAACPHMIQSTSYEDHVKTYMAFDQQGIYNWNGNDASSATKEAVCEHVGGIECLSIIPAVNGGMSVNSMMYFNQIAIEGRFQEPQSLEKYAAGERITPLVDFGAIDRVPVSIIAMINDSTCPVELSGEFVYSKLGTADKNLQIEHFGHSVPIFTVTDLFFDRFVQTIENGSSAASAV